MLVVRDMEGTFVVVSAFGIIPQGQKQLRWAWEGAERSHHTPESECLYVTCLGLPWAWTAKAGAVSTLLPPVFCPQPVCKYPQVVRSRRCRWDDPRWREQQQGSRGYQKQLHICCAVTSHSNPGIELSHHVISIWSMVMSNDLTGLWVEVIFTSFAFLDPLDLAKSLADDVWGFLLPTELSCSNLSSIVCVWGNFGAGYLLSLHLQDAREVITWKSLRMDH